MTVKFFITIDTEEDDWGEYRSSGHSVENLKQIPRLQDIFDRYGAVPTYLVTYPVAKSNYARGVFLDILSNNRCEIGTHCHPWNTPPFEEELNEQNSMLSNLPYHLVFRKIETLHREIIESFKVMPNCFRAGRFGFNSTIAKVIYDIGYQVDTSVTPFVDWGMYKGPDFRESPQHIYRFKPDNILSMKHDGGLLEVPGTIGFLQQNFALCYKMTQWMSVGILAQIRLRGILDRMRVINLRWLSPESEGGRDMVALAKNFLVRGCSHLNMSFHSTSLLPGNGPFVRSQRELESFLMNIEKLLQFATDNRLVFSPLSDALKISLPA